MLSRSHALLLSLCLALATSSHANPARHSPLQGAALYKDFDRYASFGEHRTAGDADKQTSLWLAEELEAAGFDVRRQQFPLRQFFPALTQLVIDGQPIGAFPHWFPKTSEQTITATLAALPMDEANRTSMAGHIAYLSASRAGEWHKVDISLLAERAAALGAEALVVSVPHPSNAIYARNAATPYLQQALPLPTLIVASADSQTLDLALKNKQQVEFQLQGTTEEKATAENIIARLDRGGDWIIVSTPSSGWFTAAGERGVGVALFLGAARWIAGNDKNNSYIFIANSGHKLDMMGAKYSLEEMPGPEKVKLWLHLGASIGTRQWQESEQGLLPLETHNRVFMFADWGNLFSAWKNFSDVPELMLLPAFILPSDHGERVHYIDAGYPAMGFVADHRLFHTPKDALKVSSPELLAPYGKGLEKLLGAMQ